MQVESVFVVACLIILSITVFSGCTLLKGTTFDLLSQSVSDDNGFPSLSARFNTSAQITVKIIGPTGLVHQETFFKGIHDAIMHIDGYRKTPPGGVYYFRAFDENENMIFENQMTFTEPLLDIESVDLLWWGEGDSLSLIGIQSSAVNTGDLPLYPHKIVVDVGPIEASGVTLPIVLLPNQAKSIDACLYLAGVSATSRNTEISITSFANSILGSYSENIKPIENVDELEFTWRHKGSQNLRLPELDFLYEYYSNRERFLSDDYAAYIFDQYDDSFVELIAAELNETIFSLDVVDSVNYIASFVQDIRYATDEAIDPTCTEYPRFPIELLVEGRGDCEDKAILAASLLDEIGIEVALLRLPNHMAVGVHLPEDAIAFEYYLDEYYFLETTRNRWVVGKIPEEYVGLSNASASPLSSRPLLLHTWDDATRYTSSDGSDYVRITIIVENIGNEASSNFEIQGAFYNSNNQSLNPRSVIVYGLEPGLKDEVQLEMDVPQGVTTILRTELLYNGVVVHEKESTSTFP
jgi:hypothetical protein